MQRQAGAREREQDDVRHAHEQRLQALEQRQAAAEAALRSLEARAEAAAQAQAAELDDLGQSLRGMMSQVVTRIADQFDAVQGSLEEAIAGRDADAARAAEEAAALRAQVGARLQEQGEVTETSMEALRERVDAAEAGLAAAAEREAAGAAAAAEMREALQGWQARVEGGAAEVSAKFEQYKSYVGRLRGEVKAVRDEADAVQAALVEALGRELSGLGNGVALLQRDSAGLLGQIQAGGGELHTPGAAATPAASSSSTHLT